MFDSDEILDIKMVKKYNMDEMTYITVTHQK